MSARIIPLSVLSFVLLAIFWAVVATAQEVGVMQVAAGQAVAPPANAPFAITPEEQANLDRLLVDWEALSTKVKTFEAKFKRWDFDGVFGDATKPIRFTENGTVKYAAPDKGFYQHVYNEEKDAQFNETWVCTGDAVFQFRFDVKQVREHALPANMRGKAIADGPMPFVFGVEAQKLKARYWMRITTTPEAAQKNQVWLEAYPKFAKDAANWHHVQIMLQFTYENGVVTRLDPYALKLVHPNVTNSTVFEFRELKTNSVINNINEWFGWFVRPTVPFGWQHQVVEESELAGGEQPPAEQPAPGIGSVPQPAVPR